MLLDLYHYQNDAKAACLKALNRNSYAHLAMATGLGKSPIAAAVLEALHKKHNGIKTLVLCDSVEILKNTAEKFSKWLADLNIKVGFYKTGRDDYKSYDVVFASFQSLCRSKELIPYDWFQFIITDEAHHGLAAQYSKVLSYFYAPYNLAMTATWLRSDEQDTRDYWGSFTYFYPLHKAVRDGQLRKLDYQLKLLEIDEPALNRIIKHELGASSTSRLSLSDLNRKIFIEKSDEEIVTDLKKEISDKDKCIVFCSTIQHAENLTRHFDNAKAFHGGNEDYDRSDDQVLKDFEAGEFNILFTVDRIKEGIHIDGVTTLVFLRYVGAELTWYQMMGRGLCKSKTPLRILDYANCVERLLAVEGLRLNIVGNGAANKDSKNLAMNLSGRGFSFYSQSFKKVRRILSKVETLVNRTKYKRWSEIPSIVRLTDELSSTLLCEHTEYERVDADVPLLAEKLNNVLDTLPFRSREILKLYFEIPTEHYDLGDDDVTYDSVGKCFNITQERVRQIIADAIRKMQHPVRIKKLEPFINLDERLFLR